MEVHAVWTVRPDGTMSDTLFKHHMTAPCGLRDTRSIPGSSKLVAIATGHHTFAYGPVVVIDPTAGLNSPAGLRIVTPGVQPQEGPMAGSPVPEGGVVDRGRSREVCADFGPFGNLASVRVFLCEVCPEL